MMTDQKQLEVVVAKVRLRLGFQIPQDLKRNNFLDTGIHNSLTQQIGLQAVACSAMCCA